MSAAAAHLRKHGRRARARWRCGRGPGCPQAQDHAHALVPRDAGPGPAGKMDYVPLGLHPVPRGGNWVHPKNNQTCKQLQHANVSRIDRATALKGTAVFPPPRSVCFPRVGRSSGVIWALLGSPSSSARLRSGWASALPVGASCPGAPQSGRGEAPAALSGPGCPPTRAGWLGWSTVAPSGSRVCAEGLA